MAPLRILCLHGLRQCGAVLSERLQALQDHLARNAPDLAVLDFVDGPFDIEDEERSVSKGWYRRGRPAGDWEKSLELLEARDRAAGGYDGIIGFSQGGVAAALIVDVHRRSAGARFPRLAFVILAGAPATRMPPTAGVDDNGRLAVEPASLEMPSLHFMGSRDTIVPAAESEQLAALFRNPQLVRHNQGHHLPQRAKELAVIVDFLRKHHSQAADATAATTLEEPEKEAELPEDVADELEALAAIFPPERFTVLSRRPLAVYIVVYGAHMHGSEVGGGIGSGGPQIGLRLALGAGYPDEAPAITVVGFHKLGVPSELADSTSQELQALLTSTSSENLGLPMMYTLASEAQDWIAERWDALLEAVIAVPAAAAAKGGSSLGDASIANGGTATRALAMTGQEDSDLDEEAVAELVRTATAKAAQTAAAKEAASGSAAAAVNDPTFRGVWPFTIGLVGKPSAGKSTFFNASSDPINPEDAARVAAFPFTTIDPNIGQGFFAVENPIITGPNGKTLKIQSTFGSDARGRRKLPVILKDVAGLVPGAYQGRGRGNAFLNDLCDADVLIHVVDAAGSTDKSGVAIPEGGSNPLEDVGWVREEIHRWFVGGAA
eukprot:m.305525 g.305525  ORF g.305525 m.305525 type:complete len:606 (-) comp17941_c0_seq1:1993-3810(-)